MTARWSPTASPQILPRCASRPCRTSRSSRKRERLESLLRDASGDAPCAPGEVKETVRALMWEKAGVEKDARSLNEALEEFARIRRELLPRLRRQTPVRAANYDWLDAIDGVNMIDACELIVLSSLQREESRGPFMRRDFPRHRQRKLADGEPAAQGRQRLSLREARLRSAALPAGFRARRTISRCRGERRCAAAVGAIDARRLGQAEHADSLRARNARIAIGDPIVGQDPPRRRGGRVAGIPQCRIRSAMRVLDALNAIARTTHPISRSAGSAAPRCAAPAPCA